MFATRKLLAVGFAVHWAEYCEMPRGRPSQQADAWCLVNARHIIMQCREWEIHLISPDLTGIIMT